jgi:hypothetical protein
VQLAKQGRAEKPTLRVFNTVMNVCEVCGEEDLTIKVLDAMKDTHDTEGNLITFNIALKRLAKQGNAIACEGIIIGMLQNGIEPSVVTYTTAVASCVAEPKKSDIAAEWIKRMRDVFNRMSLHTTQPSRLAWMGPWKAPSERANLLQKWWRISSDRSIPVC